jgi:NAD(P)-dependent dehydrogenase (short-subunit alcohol dehydrogenase family)
MAQFGKHSTAEQVSAGINLSGKYALVTGANTGIGCEVTRVLALRGAHVTLACRDLGKAAVARARILDDAGGRIGSERLELLQLDLNSLAGTRRAAQEFCGRGARCRRVLRGDGLGVPDAGTARPQLGAAQGIFAMVGILALPFMKSIGQGAGTTVYVATSPQYTTRGGQYFSDCREKQRPDHKLALNDSACAELWQRSAELTGIE